MEFPLVLVFFGPFAAPMGVFFFPFIYVISDVLSEVYGYRISRWVSWITAFVNIIFVGMVIGSIIGAVLTMYVIQFLLKYSVEVITEPFAHCLANKLKSIDPDSFEDRNKFNIFGFVKD